MSFWNWLKSLFAPKPKTLEDVLKKITTPVIIARPLTRFEKAVRYVMKNEDGLDWDSDKGEYTNNPKDPGGRTMWGIIQSEYELYLGHALDEAAIKTMPRETALAIYKKNFWDPIRGDLYARDIDAISIMDTAVNKGLGGCMACLKDALNQDFPIRYGDAVISSVNAAPNFIAVFEPAVERYIAKRIALYPNMAWAENGWLNRARRLLELK